MSKIKFAKIFELPDHQVLVHKIFEEGETPYKINQIMELEESVRAEINLCYTDEETRDENFEKYDEKLAQAFVSAILKLMEPEEENS